MRASFDGEIPELPGIAVDNFEAKKRAYFLSHCHSDHTSGLNGMFPKLVSADRVFIYMSEPSAAIVETHIDANLKKFIRPLKLGKTPAITIPGDEVNNIEETYMDVTLIPAGHCFGSVMFLFETNLKKVLFTGDFRINENGVSEYAQLHDTNKRPIKLDVLYVDTTFQDMEYQTFPKRSETMDYVLRTIKEWLSVGDNRVILIPSARYGYEYVLNKIYETLNEKVCVSDACWDLYRKYPLQLPGVTTNQDETRIHLCTNNRNYCPVCSNSPKDPTNNELTIKFSAMRFGNFKPEDLVGTRVGNHMNVCFATHCSRSELRYFVEYLAPKKVVGFSKPYVPVREPSVVTPRKRSPGKVGSAEKCGERPKKLAKSVQSFLFG